MDRILEICREKTNLSQEDLEILISCAQNLPLISGLTGGDVFLDCPCADGSVICFAAEHPASSRINFYSKITPEGFHVSPADEPGVYTVLQTGQPYNNQLGRTPNGIPIKQDIVPVKNGDRVIGALIKEEDCSESVLRNQKYEAVVRSNVILREAISLSSNIEDDINGTVPVDVNYLQLQLKESNHRIKNSLQTISSIMRMEARRSQDPILRQKMAENASRILTVATIHDMLSVSSGISVIDVHEVLEKLLDLICSYASSECQIYFCVHGDECVVEYEKAIAIALAVNELVSNALKYAFTKRQQGRIDIYIDNLDNYKKISVADDGVGFHSDFVGGMGLRLVESVVKEKLSGRIWIGPGGTVDKPTGTLATIEWR